MSTSIEVMSANAANGNIHDDFPPAASPENDFCEPSALNPSGNEAAAVDGDPDQYVTKPGQHDVLLGRGGGTNNHNGNVRFRKLVNEHKMRYLACSKVDKPKVAREVVQLWRKMDPPGRFLARKDDTKRGPGSVKAADTVWYEVGDKKAREKASQCLRERTPDVLPYIKQLREQQDAITEHGVSMVQHQLQMQAHHDHYAHPNAMRMHPQFGNGGQMQGGFRQHGHLPHDRMTMPPQGAMMGGTPRGPMNGYYEDDMNANFNGGNNGDLSEMEYHHNMRMMQQQLEMQQMQLERMRAQRNQRGMGNAPSGGGFSAGHPGGDMAPSQPMRRPNYNEGLGAQQQLQQQPRQFYDQQDPLMSMPQQQEHNSRPKRTRENVPDQAGSCMPEAQVGMESGELTLEEYRQQLEEYITTQEGGQDNPRASLNSGAIDNEDLEDDWEKEKERNLEEQKRGVDRNISGISLMSAKTTKSNVSMISGFSGLSDLINRDQDSKMELQRTLSSNLSLMSDMTDLSHNIDNLSIYDDDNGGGVPVH